MTDTRENWSDEEREARLELRALIGPTSAKRAHSRLSKLDLSVTPSTKKRILKIGKHSFIASAVVIAAVTLVSTALVLNFLWIGYNQGSSKKIRTTAYWEQFAGEYVGGRIHRVQRQYWRVVRAFEPCPKATYSDHRGSCLSCEELFEARQRQLLTFDSLTPPECREFELEWAQARRRY